MKIRITAQISFPLPHPYEPEMSKTLPLRKKNSVKNAKHCPAIKSASIINNENSGENKWNIMIGGWFTHRIG